MPDEDQNKAEEQAKAEEQNQVDQTDGLDPGEEGEEDSGTTYEQAVTNLTNEVLRVTGMGGVLRSRARAQAAHLNNLAQDVQKHLEAAGAGGDLVDPASLNTVVDDQNRTGPSAAVKSASTQPGKTPKKTVDAITGTAPAPATAPVIGAADQKAADQLASQGATATSTTTGEVLAEGDAGKASGKRGKAS